MLFASAGNSPVYEERLAIVLGILTLVSALAAFISCRTCLGWLTRLGVKDITQNRPYAWFYKWHLYYWWSFGVFVVAHLMVAVVHTGLPQAGDPDAPVHWWILGLGLFSALSGILIFFSCRIMPRLMTMLRSSNPLERPSYRSFTRGHSYYWASMGLLVLGHFLVAFNHAGIWPGG
jgi:cytochrome b561